MWTNELNDTLKQLSAALLKSRQPGQPLAPSAAPPPPQRLLQPRQIPQLVSYEQKRNFAASKGKAFQLPPEHPLRVCCLNTYSTKIPDANESQKLKLAGLGYFTIPFRVGDRHDDMDRALVTAFPKLALAAGQWLLGKRAGSGNCADLVTIVSGERGYSIDDLKQNDGLRKGSTVFLSPLVDLTMNPPTDEEVMRSGGKFAQCPRCGIRRPHIYMDEHMRSYHEKDQEDKPASTTSQTVLGKRPSESERDYKRAKLSPTATMTQIQRMGQSLILPCQGSTTYQVYRIIEGTWTKSEVLSLSKVITVPPMFGGMRKAEVYKDSQGHEYVLKNFKEDVLKKVNGENFKLLKREAQGQMAAAMLLAKFNATAKRLQLHIAPLEIIECGIAVSGSEGRWLYYSIEERLKGHFVKYSCNDGDEIILEGSAASTVSAFTHWTIEHTKGKLAVLDLQGVGPKLTDVQVVDRNPPGARSFSLGNMKTVALENFVKRHVCNFTCEDFGLKPLREAGNGDAKTEDNEQLPSLTGMVGTSKNIRDQSHQVHEPTGVFSTSRNIRDQSHQVHAPSGMVGASRNIRDQSHQVHAPSSMVGSKYIPRRSKDDSTPPVGIFSRMKRSAINKQF